MKNFTNSTIYNVATNIMGYDYEKGLEYFDRYTVDVNDDWELAEWIELVNIAAAALKKSLFANYLTVDCGPLEFPLVSFLKIEQDRHFLRVHFKRNVKSKISDGAIRCLTEWEDSYSYDYDILDCGAEELNIRFYAAGTELENTPLENEGLYWTFQNYEAEQF